MVIPPPASGSVPVSNQQSRLFAGLYADNTGNQWRVIPLDGRPHGTDPEVAATYNGDSVGHWEGDTLVVDVTRLTDETWLGDNGLFHSRKLHVTERLRRVGDTIEYKMPPRFFRSHGLCRAC